MARWEVQSQPSSPGACDRGRSHGRTLPATRGCSDLLARSLLRPIRPAGTPAGTTRRTTWPAGAAVAGFLHLLLLVSGQNLVQLGIDLFLQVGDLLLLLVGQL